MVCSCLVLGNGKFCGTLWMKLTFSSAVLSLFFFIFMFTFTLDILRFNRDFFTGLRIHFIFFSASLILSSPRCWTLKLSFSGRWKMLFKWARKFQDFSVKHPESLSILFTRNKLKRIGKRKKKSLLNCQMSKGTTLKFVNIKKIEPAELKVSSFHKVPERSLSRKRQDTVFLSDWRSKMQMP